MSSSRKVGQALLGVVEGIDSGTSGTLYVDAFESRKNGSFSATEQQGMLRLAGEEETGLRGMMEAGVELNGRMVSRTITYSYDGLNRLTGAVYDDGMAFHYSYDAVGNRLGQAVRINLYQAEETTSYTYDAANRLESANGVSYSWDANGNLLNDGVWTYSYDHANRLRGMTNGVEDYSYFYNGQGERMKMVANGVTTTYVLDQAAGLTQVLADGTYSYLYGNGRIGQEGDTDAAYFLGDGLGSVRVMVDGSGQLGLTRDYRPYGEVLGEAGEMETVYGFTGESQDGTTGLVYLRVRYYNPVYGQFIGRDIWQGNYYRPGSLNRWNYVEGNPVNRIDPLGKYFWGPGETLLNSSTNRLQSQNVSVRVQEIAMIEGGMANIHAEYPIPPEQIKVDLLNSITGEVWEIKPWTDQSEAVLELNARLVALENAHNNNLLSGMNPVALPYDWNQSPALWLEGYSFRSEVFLGTDDTGQFDLYAGQTVPGVIAWWKYKKPKPEKVPYPIYLPYPMQKSERNERPNWVPRSGQTPQPVYAFQQPDPEVGEILILIYIGYKMAEFCVNPLLPLVTP